jgi:hypothetical protein
MPIESYLHKHAKKVFAGWLHKYFRIGQNFKGMNGIDLNINWEWCRRHNAILIEYPVCVDRKTKKLIGLMPENNSEIKGIEWSDWLKSQSLSINASVPNHYDLKKWKEEKRLKILYIFDIAVIDNSGLKYVFEVCHKSPSSDKKIKWLNDHKIKGYEISAGWIMNQVKSPYTIEILKKF